MAYLGMLDDPRGWIISGSKGQKQGGIIDVTCPRLTAGDAAALRRLMARAGEQHEAAAGTAQFGATPGAAGAGAGMGPRGGAGADKGSCERWSLRAPLDFKARLRQLDARLASIQKGAVVSLYEDVQLGLFAPCGGVPQLGRPAALRRLVF